MTLPLLVFTRGGVSVGLPFSAGFGFTTNKDYKNSIPGVSANFSAMAGLGGSLSISHSTIAGEIQGSVSGGLYTGVSYVWWMGETAI